MLSLLNLLLGLFFGLLSFLGGCLFFLLFLLTFILLGLNLVSKSLFGNIALLISLLSDGSQSHSLAIRNEDHVEIEIVSIFTDLVNTVVASPLELEETI